MSGPGGTRTSSRIQAALYSIMVNGAAAIFRHSGLGPIANIALKYLASSRPSSAFWSGFSKLRKEFSCSRRLGRPSGAAAVLLVFIRVVSAIAASVSARVCRIKILLRLRYRHTQGPDRRRSRQRPVWPARPRVFAEPPVADAAPRHAGSPSTPRDELSAGHGRPPRHVERRIDSVGPTVRRHSYIRYECSSTRRKIHANRFPGPDRRRDRPGTPTGQAHDAASERRRQPGISTLAALRAQPSGCRKVRGVKTPSTALRNHTPQPPVWPRVNPRED